MERRRSLSSTHKKKTQYLYWVFLFNTLIYRLAFNWFGSFAITGFC